MDQFEMQQALKRAQDRAEAQKAAGIIGFILTCVYAYYSPEWMWFQGNDIGCSNLILFFVIAAVVIGGLCWLVDKVTVDKR